MTIPKEEWASTFNRASDTYDRVGPRFFSYFGEKLVALAQLPSGARLLDIATGRGAILFPAITKVGSEGEAIGIDLSEVMVEKTALDLQNQHISNARVLKMDAEKLEFEDASFDAVLCGFAIFFFPEPAKAIEEISRVLKPGGLLGLSTWGKGDERWKWVEELSPKPAVQTGTSASQSIPAPRTAFDEPELLKTFLGQHNFTNIQVIKEEADFTYVDEEDWWNSQWSHGARIYLEKIPPQILEQGRKIASLKMQPLKQADRIHQIFRALFTYANKSEA